MECYNNFIGVDKTTDTPASNKWITDLPGLTLDVSDSVRDEEESESVFQFLRRKIDFATDLVLDDLSGKVAPYFRFNSFLDTYNKGEFRGEYFAAAVKERGVKISGTNSRLSRIKVRSVTVSAIPGNPAATRELIIKDGIKTTTYSFVITDETEYTIPLDYTAKTNNIYILLDNTDLEVDKGKVNYNCGNCSGGGKTVSNFYNIYGWDGDTVNSNYSYGLKVNFEVVCSEEELLCALQSKMGLIVLYKSGVEVLKEWIYSNRPNYFTLNRDDAAKELLESWEHEYQTRWDILVKNLPDYLGRIDTVCLQCNKNRYRETI